MDFSTFLIFFALYLISMALKALVQFKPISDWWIQNSTTQDNCFSIYDVALWQYAHPIFWLRNITKESGASIIKSDSWIYFITGFLYSGGFADDGGYTNKILPRNFCETIAPVSGTVNPYDTTGGVWPSWPVTTPDWRTKIKTWGITWDPVSQDYHVDKDKWSSTPENFLWKMYQFEGDSPAVAAFVTNLSNVPNIGDRLYAEDLGILLGLNQGASSGGLFGFCQVVGDIPPDEIWRRLYQSEPSFTQNKAPPKGKCSGSDKYSAALGSLNGAMLGAMLVTPFLGPAGEFAKIAIMAAAVIAGGATQGLITAGQNGCL